MNNEKLLTQDELLARWGGHVTKLALKGWRQRGKGPAYVKLGGKVLYKEADVEAYERQAHRNAPATVEAADE